MLRIIKEKFSLGQTVMPPSYTMASLHSHNVYELYYMKSGSCSINLNTSVHKISTGMFLLIPPYCHHKTTYLADNSHHRMVLHFPIQEFQYYENLLSDVNLLERMDNHVFVVPPNKLDYVNNLLHAIKQESLGVDSLSEHYRMLYCTALFLFLLRIDENPKKVSIERASIKNELIQEIIEYIQANYTSPITLKDTAQKFNLSESGLTKKFKTFSGYRFKEYLAQVRINHAKELLTTTNKSMTEISDLCGFANTNHFGDTFRKITNMSPTAYRKQYLPPHI